MARMRVWNRKGWSTCSLALILAMLLAFARPAIPQGAGESRAAAQAQADPGLQAEISLKVEKPLPFANPPETAPTSESKTETTSQPEPAATGQNSSRGWVFAMVGCVCLGAFGLAAGAGGIFILRSRRKPVQKFAPSPVLNQAPAIPASDPCRAAPAPQKATLTQARLVVIHGPANPPQLELASQPVTIGRGPQNLLVIKNSNVSRHHAHIDLFNGEWTIIDLNSVNGTFVNNAPITRQALRGGDQIQIGVTILEFQIIP